MNKINREKLKKIAGKYYDELDGIFTDTEAWFLFRTVAFLETFGWMCLLFGIYAASNDWPYGDSYVAVGGTIHGLLFLAYNFIVIFAHRSLGWSIKKFVIALIVSNIPFGALVFEQYIARERNRFSHNSTK